MEDWLAAEERVARYGNVPKPEFLRERHHTIGMMLALVVFTPYGLDLDLPAEFIEHPAVADLLWSLTRVASWQSDLLTLDVELARGEHVNTIEVLGDRHGRSREEGTREVYRRYRRDIAESFQLMGTVLDIDWGPLTSGVDTFCDGVLSTSAGFLAWNQLTDRNAVGLVSGKDHS
jgi:hypothetical protein